MSGQGGSSISISTATLKLEGPKPKAVAAATALQGAARIFVVSRAPQEQGRIPDFINELLTQDAYDMSFFLLPSVFQRAPLPTLTWARCSHIVRFSESFRLVRASRKQCESAPNTCTLRSRVSASGCKRVAGQVLRSMPSYRATYTERHKFAHSAVAAFYERRPAVIDRRYNLWRCV